MVFFIKLALNFIVIIAILPGSANGLVCWYAHWAIGNMGEVLFNKTAPAVPDDCSKYYPHRNHTVCTTLTCEGGDSHGLVHFVNRGCGPCDRMPQPPKGICKCRHCASDLCNADPNPDPDLHYRVPGLDHIKPDYKKWNKHHE